MGYAARANRFSACPADTILSQNAPNERTIFLRLHAQQQQHPGSGQEGHGVLSRREGDVRSVVDVPIVLRSDADFANLADTDALWQALGVRYSAEREAYRVASVSYRGFGFWETVGGSFVYSFRIGGTLFRTLGQLLTVDIGLSAFGGPVTTIRLTSQIASRGVQPFLEIAAFIGVNLAVFNLLPIPALDGSRILFTLHE